ncbi:alanine racemase [Cohnella suwonensis]|uniref:Alanine racemase n=1 Tax=Cohnella suwonensis TaxID=696072 RepID=A0ABW0LW45_9BACL
MDCYYRPTVAEISLDALAHNIGAFRGRIAAGTKLLASVKANGYGHGAVEIAKAAVAAGADYLGVAFLDEALQLREAGIAAPILVLGYTPPEGLRIAMDNGITVTAFRDETLDAAERLPTGGKRLKAHVKIDSGMARLGVMPGEAAERFLKRASGIPQLEVEGLFTHFARADEKDKAYTRMQADRFGYAVRAAKRLGLDIPIVHAGNSATGIDLPEDVGQMLRLGIGMYGLYPSDEVDAGRLALKPVLGLKTQVVYVKSLPAGEGIGYGTRYFTGGTESIGTIPIGYADGYSRMLSGKAEALVRGRRVPVVGTIAMDQCMIRLDGAVAPGEPPIAPGEEVVLIGRQGDEEITAEEVAAWLDTLNYEVTCMVAARVPRKFRKNDDVVQVVNALIR